MAEPRFNPDLVPLLYHFCRLRLPAIALPLERFTSHLEQALELAQKKRVREGLSPESLSVEQFIQGLHTLDFFLASACLDCCQHAWEALFNTRASRSDVLLVDALRSRAIRLMPRNAAWQEEAVDEFWGHLLAGQKEGSLPVLARYDGQRPLVPWLICVFHNQVLSGKRAKHPQSLSDLDPGEQELPLPEATSARWHTEFCAAAREWLAELGDRDVLLLGLMLRYHQSQREVARLLGRHEGNVSRRLDTLVEQFQERVGQTLADLGWTGDNLMEFVRTELDTVLLAEPRLSADRLATLAANLGQTLPAGISRSQRAEVRSQTSEVGSQQGDDRGSNTDS
jgi:RNA polymerase sigma factor (sigma-70 family)